MSRMSPSLTSPDADERRAKSSKVVFPPIFGRSKKAPRTGRGSRRTEWGAQSESALNRTLGAEQFKSPDPIIKAAFNQTLSEGEWRKELLSSDYGPSPDHVREVKLRTVSSEVPFGWAVKSKTKIDSRLRLSDTTGGGSPIRTAAESDVMGEVQTECAQQMREDWVREYQDKFLAEKDLYKSALVSAEVKLQEVMDSLGGAQRPHQLVTSVVCLLTEQLRSTAQLKDSCLNMMLDEMFRSIYRNYDAICEPDADAPKHFEHGVSYFREVERLEKEMREMQSLMYMMETEISMYKDKMKHYDAMRAKGNVLLDGVRKKVVASTLRKMRLMRRNKCFIAWRDWASNEKRTRTMMRRVVTNWRRNQVRSCFYAWKMEVQGEVSHRHNQAYLNEMMGESEAAKYALEQEIAELQAALDKSYESVDAMQAEINRLTKALALANATNDNLAEEQRKASEGFSSQSGIGLDLLSVLESMLEQCAEDLRLVDVAVDPTRLLAGETFAAMLEAVPLDQVMLRWVSIHLTEFDVSNFSTDWADGEFFFRLFNAIAPSICDMSGLETGDVDKRVDNFINQLESVPANTDLPHVVRFVSPGSIIYQKAADLNVALVCVLCTMFPSMRAEDHMGPAPDLHQQQMLLMGAVEGLKRKKTIEKDKIFELVENVNQCFSQCSARRKQADSGSRQWRQLEVRLHSFVRQILCARLNERPMAFEDEEFIAERNRYSFFDESRLSDLLQNESKPSHEYAALIQYFQNKFRWIKKVFCFYRKKGETNAFGGINHKQFVVLCADIKCINPSFLNEEQVIALWSKCSGSAPRTEGCELMPSGFIEAMIRIAAEAPLFNLPNGSSLSLKATTFLEKMVAPFAQAADPEEFRRELTKPDIRIALARQKPLLEKIFSHFASLNDAADANIPVYHQSIDLTEWTIFLKDAKMFDDHFTPAHAKQLFGDVQQEEPMDGDEEPDEDESGLTLSFQEFMEAIAALMFYKEPNPYMPFLKRSMSFRTNFLNHVKDKIEIQEAG